MHGTLITHGDQKVVIHNGKTYDSDGEEEVEAPDWLPQALTIMTKEAVEAEGLEHPLGDRAPRLQTPPTPLPLLVPPDGLSIEDVDHDEAPIVRRNQAPQAPVDAPGIARDAPVPAPQTEPRRFRQRMIPAQPEPEARTEPETPRPGRSTEGTGTLPPSSGSRGGAASRSRAEPDTEEGSGTTPRPRSGAEEDRPHRS